MKVEVELVGLYNVTDKLGKKRFLLDIGGSTIRDVLDNFIKLYPEAREGLVKEDGSLDDDIQVVVNGEKVVKREDIDREELREGDRVSFLLLITGG